MRILLVDDDEMLRRCLRTFLEQQGHDVTTVSDGEQAVSVLSSWRFDVVVTDYQMPRMNGLLLAAECVNEFHKPVVMMSAEPALADLLEARGLQHVPFLKKPFRLVELEAAIQGSVGEVGQGVTSKSSSTEHSFGVTKASVN